MIKSHIISCPICDNILTITPHYSPHLTNQSKNYSQELGGSGYDKICSQSKLGNHILILRFNSFLELYRIILIPKYFKNLEFHWINNSILRVVDVKLNSEFNLPWFEPDLYLYEELIKKLKTYVLFS